MEAQAREYFVRRLNEVAAEKVRAKAVELFGPSGRPEQPTWGEVFAGALPGAASTVFNCAAWSKALAAVEAATRPASTSCVS